MRPNILFISIYPPYPLKSGDNIRIYNILVALAKFCDIYLVSFYGQSGYPINEAKISLESICKSVWFIKRGHNKNIIIKSISSIPKINTLFNLWFCNPEALSIIKKIIIDLKINVVWFEKTFSAHYIKSISDKTVKTIMGTQNYESDVTYQSSKLIHFSIKKMLRLTKWLNELIYERRYSHLVDKITVVSDNDAQLYHKLVDQSKIEIIPNCINLNDYEGNYIEKENSICFTGSMSYFPNIDAMMYFIDKIWKVIKNNYYNVKLYIVGNNPPTELKKFESHDVIITGLVESTIPYLKKSKVAIVPLRYGGGTRLKILESMACSTPVVSTSLGCEGLDVTKGENILIADTPKDFALAIIKLLKSSKLRKRIGYMGKELVKEKYSLEANRKRLKKLIYDLISQ